MARAHRAEADDQNALAADGMLVSLNALSRARRRSDGRAGA